MDRDALALMTRRPAQVARWCGSTLLTDELHGQWMRQMITGREDMTLLAHRGSYKTTCLAAAMAISMCVYPMRNMLFMRKTDGDVIEIIRQVKMLLQSDAMLFLTQKCWGEPVNILRADQFSITTDCYAARRGAAQLLGQGTKGSLTGKHADIIITDDIVNLQDRISPQEREHTRAIYQELQNIRIPGGRIINTGTPWHPQDAIALMPRVERYDCYHTGLLTQDKLDELRRSMSPTLFAANYELKHIGDDNALFVQPPEFFDDPLLLRDGIAHIDAAYGGSDFTALTCARREGDTLFLYGRLFKGHVDTAMEALLAECDQLLCAPIWCETNGDKGYVARELRRLGAQVRTYQERQNKHLKISTHLRKWWPRIRFLRSADPAYIDQILAYSMSAAHDDAPDSAACVCRILDHH
ncbi:MAG: hypothetical protein E7316_10495 [Clostridiales bacterium]|nr:hypothetical protein [Clostridiales bacterium]